MISHAPVILKVAGRLQGSFIGFDQNILAALDEGSPAKEGGQARGKEEIPLLYTGTEKVTLRRISEPPALNVLRPWL